MTAKHALLTAALAATLASVKEPGAEASLLGLGPDDWRVEWNGYGRVQLDPAEGILLDPLAASQPGETHSALVIARSTEAEPLRDFRIRMIVVTERQLRRNAPPNPWEVFWLFFNRHATAGQTARSSNYVIFKPNGTELGRSYAGTGQAFLATNRTVTPPIGAPILVQVTKRGGRIDASVNGMPALSYRGAGLYDVPGSIGLYSEDARVRVYSVNIERLGPA